MPIIELKNINVTFKQADKDIIAVRDETLTVDAGDIYGIVGYSGAGKSTLVRNINLLQRPTSGEVIINGQDLTSLSAKELRNQRKKIGMIFQHFNLLDEITVFENILQPLKHASLTTAEKKAKVTELLELVGLTDRATNYPSELSGGQKQRVAIARALVNDPDILLSDEATSALDPRTTNQILKLLKKVNQTLGVTIILITHEMQVVKEIANKVAVMENGHIIERGSLLEIFTNPQKPLTKDFINTATNLDAALENVQALLETKPLTANEKLIQIQYVGNDTAQPLLATIYADYGVTPNILYSNMEILTQTPVGLAIAVFNGPDDTAINNALQHFREQGVGIKILTEGGRA
ncbi:Methionine import ATP-binding protein MetN [Weissella ceti]|uniref:Methionine import ATP-binding protein MetN n=2 Tax=Weissella TaxID=46255 RepID=A0A075U7D9_9LACO|nr:MULTISPECIES: ATP-binding cassette domain-containing protein [Weissella]AIG66007.1 Methionine import ATP-binding protein MetN [Weissella tructae]AIM63387.1 Methionine import ATP-binding protein MetN [Weissella ceti]AIM64721.1 Methionine import ATP-binding protein MetN [Weissella ceti]